MATSNRRISDCFGRKEEDMSIRVKCWVDIKKISGKWIKGKQIQISSHPPGMVSMRIGNSPMITVSAHELRDAIANATRTSDI